MTSAAALNAPHFSLLSVFCNEELVKALSYVPIVGLVPSFLGHTHHRSVMSSVIYLDLHRGIHCINQINDYRMANIVRNILNLALIVSFTVAGFFSTAGAVLAGGLAASFLAYNIYALAENTQTLRVVLQTGVFSSNLKVV